MSEIEDDQGNPIGTGAVLSTHRGEYVLEELLGEGGFGAVYRVHLTTDKNTKFAMKIEKKMAKRRHSKLKMEIFILKLLANENKNKRHFTAIVDRAKKSNFFFLVMQLVGKSLEDLVHDSPTRTFSLATCFGVGIQCLEALEDLHKVGFLHRDLKPANYACGLGEKAQVIYLLDFGIARKYMHTDSELKTPRCIVNFKGTIRYASINCHKGLELGPKDDAESWFYMLIELMVPRGLPWRRLNDRSIVFQSKQDSRSKYRDLLLPPNECRIELGLLLDYTDKMHYTDKLDYEYYYKLLRLCADIEKVNINEPYDWCKDKTSNTSDPSRDTFASVHTNAIVPNSTMTPPAQSPYESSRDKQGSGSIRKK